jgi:XTP/dITP diphosphohydrolase
MNTTIFFGTNNAHKLAEIQAMVGAPYHIRSFKDLATPIDVAETANTLEGNAALKAESFYAHTQLPCFADDTGLEVQALGGAPGVYSARYAGATASSEQNVAKLLQDLENVDMGAWGSDNRRARFRTVIAFYDGKQMHYFEGEISGVLTYSPCGTNGFGYDPIFLPDGYAQTFAEMPASLKNTISHRALAVAKFAAHLHAQLA